jgi:AcrR family transcriptional regulator
MFHEYWNNIPVVSRCGMAKTSRPVPRREESLTRERIVDAAIVLLDDGGEAGLTFRALSERLATGPGAIYWHIADKSDLLTAACDAVVARTLAAAAVEARPDAAIRAVALGLFDAIDAHPWVGSALMRAPQHLPLVRILERIGQQLHALGVAHEAQWAAGSALSSYILGVSGQNAANAHVARHQKLDRSTFLHEIAATWSQLDPNDYPFVRRMAVHLPDHDDRADYLAGIDLILSGLEASRRRAR